MNNSKTSILAMIAGSILFVTSFAIGASSDRVEVSTDRTSSFAYPKVDEIAPIAPEISTTKPELKQKSSTVDKSSSVAAMPVVAPKQHRVSPISKKFRAKIERRRDVKIPVSPANKVPLDVDRGDRPNPTVTIEKAVSDLSENVSQTVKKQQPNEVEPKEIRAEINQSQEAEKIAPKSSPEKSAKDLKPELPAVEAPKELTPETPTPSEASD